MSSPDAVRCCSCVASPERQAAESGELERPDCTPRKRARAVGAALATSQDASGRRGLGAVAWFHVTTGRLGIVREIGERNGGSHRFVIVRIGRKYRRLCLAAHLSADRCFSNDACFPRTPGGCEDGCDHRLPGTVAARVRGRAAAFRGARGRGTGRRAAQQGLGETGPAAGRVRTVPRVDQASVARHRRPLWRRIGRPAVPLPGRFPPRRAVRSVDRLPAAGPPPADRSARGGAAGCRVGRRVGHALGARLRRRGGHARGPPAAGLGAAGRVPGRAAARSPRTGAAGRGSRRAPPLRRHTVLHAARSTWRCSSGCTPCAG